MAPIVVFFGCIGLSADFGVYHYYIVEFFGCIGLSADLGVYRYYIVEFFGCIGLSADLGVYMYHYIDSRSGFVFLCFQILLPCPWNAQHPPRNRKCQESTSDMP